MKTTVKHGLLFWIATQQKPEQAHFRASHHSTKHWASIYCFVSI